MSTAPSTIPTVKAALLAKFRAATDPEQTDVWPSRTNEDHQQAENVYLGETGGDRHWKTLGPGNIANQREENYSVQVEVEVFREGTDIEGTEARLWEIVQALEQALAEDKTLAEVPHVQWVLVGRFREQTGPVAKTPDLDEGILSKCSFAVEVVGRI